MAEAPQEQYIFDTRDLSEKDRLDQQSKAILALRSNHVFESGIPKAELRRVADVGTGTGIWIEEAFDELAKAGNTECEFVGFDISSALFPAQETEKQSAYLNSSEFEIADIHQGFPEEYHGQFDLVHLRLLVFVIEKSKLRNAVENVLKLLRPGGYIHWCDARWHGLSQSMYPDTPYGSLASGGAAQVAFIEEMNWSTNLLSDISQMLKELGSCEAVSLTDYFQANFNKPELQTILWKWHVQTISRFMMGVALRNGKSESEAKEMARVYGETAANMGRNGVVLPFPLETLVARKKAI